MRRYLLLVRTSLRSIFANKMRSFLTILGIVIGVAAVLIMISVGNSASVAVTSQIEGLGSNVIFVVARFHGGGKPLSLEDADALRRIAGVRQVSPEVNAQATVVNRDRTYTASLIGALPEYEQVRNSRPAAGRFITEADVASRSRVVVLGHNVYKELFNSANPIGQTIKLNGTLFTVVGVLEEKGGGAFGASLDDVVIVPLSTAMFRILGSRDIAFISVQVADPVYVDAVRDTIEQVLMQRHGLRTADEADFALFSQADILSTMSTVTNILTILLAGIAAISLLVGGIGIMNIMLVSVTERTREIGIRMAVGARRRDILFQFLLESMLLCSVGGVAGIVLGIAGANVVANIGGWKSIILPSTIALSFLFSAAVGLFFGIYPAAKASRLKPIEALRYE